MGEGSGGGVGRVGWRVDPAATSGDLQASTGSRRGPRRRRPRAAPWAPPPLPRLLSSPRQPPPPLHRRRGRGPPGRPHSAPRT
jgi:hypothetical protein